ncbi:MAG: HypC/HybG/HupF family hydrogenase formation chaperone [Holophagales bacterium]|nr:HypC/HybG/HupF family hydrogenase formation chaperone [Holophagales bacterium]
MCLGVPGRVVEVVQTPIGVPTGKVDFAGIVKEVCFAYTPEVEVGEYVVVHVGFAISKIDEEEAHRVFRYLKEMGELEGVDEVEASTGEAEAGR